MNGTCAIMDHNMNDTLIVQHQGLLDDVVIRTKTLEEIVLSVTILPGSNRI